MYRLWLCPLAIILLMIPAVASQAASDNPVPLSALPSLLLGPDDLPGDLILVSRDPSDGSFYAYPKERSERAQWVGKPVRYVKNTRSTPSTSIQLIIVVTPSAGDAIKAVGKETRNLTAVFDDLSGSPVLRLFTDRAWLSYDTHPDGALRSGRLFYTRHNVVVSISCTAFHDSHPYKVKTIYDLAQAISRRIDAAANGRPLPLRTLPLPAGRDRDASWFAWHAAQSFGGSDRRIVLALPNQEPVILPAVRRSGRDDLVPLQYLVSATPEPRAKVRIEGKEATCTIAGKAVKVVDGSRTAWLAGRQIHLSAPAAIRNKQVFVPVTLLEAVLGRKAARSSKDNRQILTFR